MTWQLAEKMTDWCIRQGLLAQEDYPMYVYCIDLLLGKLFFYAALLLVAGWFDILAVTFCYYLGFLPFRYTAGGYHAKTNLSCVVLTWAVYGGSMLLVTWAEQFSAMWTAGSALFLVLLATVAAWRYAPIDHVNKPVLPARKKQMRRQCLAFQTVFMITILLFLWQQYHIWAFSIALGNGIAALFLLVAYYQKEGTNL